MRRGYEYTAGNIISGLLRSLGLLGAVRASKSLVIGAAKNISWRASRRKVAPDGLPEPSPGLCFTVSGNYDVDYFLRTGQQGADSIREILARNNRPIEEHGNILDFGCGCGRITRYWHGLPNSRITGTDINPKLIRWADRNLSFGRFLTNGIAEPLPFEDGAFDLIYAISVFTHLREDLQKHWMKELVRLLRPGGLLLITVKGDNWKLELDSDQQASFDQGNMVVLEPENSGSNYCGAYHPPDYVRSVLAAGLEVLEHEPYGSKDTRQDLYLLEKPEAPAS